MRPQLLMTPLAQYERVEWNGKNESGKTPINDYVLILPDGAAEATAGKVLIPEPLRERHSMAAETGVLIANGAGAWQWNSDRSRPYGGEAPQPGQRVCFERYAGATHHGKDGRMYRLMQDKCVSALDD